MVLALGDLLQPSTLHSAGLDGVADSELVCFGTFIGTTFDLLLFGNFFGYAVYLCIIIPRTKPSLPGSI